jgi:hypothetical protein
MRIYYLDQSAGRRNKVKQRGATDLKNRREPAGLNARADLLVPK